MQYFRPRLHFGKKNYWQYSRCLNYHRKSRINIASGASYVYIMDKSSLKMPKMVNFDEFLKTWSLRSNSVNRQVNFNRTKISKKCQNSKIQIQHFGWVSNIVLKGYNLKKIVKVCLHYSIFPSKKRRFCLSFLLHFFIMGSRVRKWCL